MNETETVEMQLRKDVHLFPYRRQHPYGEDCDSIIDRIARLDGGSPFPSVDDERSDRRAQQPYPILTREHLSLDQAVAQNQALQRELEHTKAKVAALWREMASMRRAIEAVAAGNKSPVRGEVVEQAIASAQRAAKSAAAKIFANRTVRVDVIRDRDTESGAVGAVDVIASISATVDEMVEFERNFYSEVAAADAFSADAPVDINLRFER